MEEKDYTCLGPNFEKIFHSSAISVAKVTSVSSTMAFWSVSGNTLGSVSFISPYTPE
jgi:hypothetical protein